MKKSSKNSAEDNWGIEKALKLLEESGHGDGQYVEALRNAVERKKKGISKPTDRIVITGIYGKDVR